jgi:hypothetical protein
MSYTASLGPQTISIANQGNQTVITLSSQAAGQQQSQSSRFTTGEWRTPPALFRTPNADPVATSVALCCRTNFDATSRIIIFI